MNHSGALRDGGGDTLFKQSAGVPRLRGPLLVAYRVAWIVLALSALSAMVFAVLQWGNEPGITALRLVKGVILLSVSGILFRRRQRDPVAAMLGLAFLLWTITSSVDFNIAYQSWPALLDRIRFLLFALALLLFPDGEWHPLWTRGVAVAVIVVFLVGAAEAVGLLPTRLYLLPAIGCVLLAMFALMQRYRYSHSLVERQQLKWVALGLVGGIALILAARTGGALTAGMPMPVVSRVLLEAAFQLGIVLVALGFLISLLRFRLYDAEAAISHSAALAALTICLVGIFAGSEAVIETISQTYIPGGIGNVSGAIAAAIAAVFLSPLHGRLTEWAEQRFQRELVALKTELPALLAEHVGSASPRTISTAALPHILTGVQASRAALLLDHTVVDAHGVDIGAVRRWARGWESPDVSGSILRESGDSEFPLKLPIRCARGGIRGWLLLGPRPDGTFYGKDDVEALTAILPPLRQTLIAAREREKEKIREEKLHRATRRTLDQVALRLAALEAAIKPA